MGGLQATHSISGGFHNLSDPLNCKTYVCVHICFVCIIVEHIYSDIHMHKIKNEKPFKKENKIHLEDKICNYNSEPDGNGGYL